MSELAVIVFVWMVGLMPPRQNDVPRLREYEVLAIAIADAAEEDPSPLWSASMLTAIARMESDFRVRAIGRGGERGAWQIMGDAPRGVREQAREALRRVNVSWALCSSLSLFTGERCRPTHPYADHRAELAWRLMTAEPWGL